MMSPLTTESANTLYPFTTFHLFTWRGDKKHGSCVIEPATIYQNSLMFLFPPILLPVHVLTSYISRESPADRRHSSGALFGVVVEGRRLSDCTVAVLGDDT